MLEPQPQPCPGMSADEWQQKIEAAKLLVSWPYGDSEPIAKALTAGDSDAPDREGNRAAAQYGAKLVEFVVMTLGRWRGVSRAEQQNAVQAVTSKEACASLARDRGLDKLVKPSIRQSNVPPQPTILKNAIFALVAAVFEHSCDFSSTVLAMYGLGLISTTEWLPGIFDATGDTQESDIPEPNTTFTDASFSWDQDVPQGLLLGESFNWAQSFDATQSVFPHLATVPFPESSISNASAIPLDPQTLNSGNELDHQIPLSFEQHYGQARSSFQIQGQTEHRVFHGGSFDAGRLHDPPLKRAKYDRTLCEAEAKSSGSNSSGSNSSGSDSSGSNSSGSNSSESRALDFHSSYYNAIAQISPTAHAKFVLQLGTSSAAVSVKGIVTDMRNSESYSEVEADHATDIANMRPANQRLASIHALSIQIARFRLARRLHIYMYWLETQDPSDNDPFINQSGAPSSARQPRGNPKYRRIAERTKHYRDLTPRQNEGQSEAKRLRRVGDRLSILVDQFEPGVLALLSEDISDATLLNGTKDAFSKIVRTMDQFEGKRIRELSRAARPVVDMLLSKPSSDVTLRLERMEDEDIRKVSRCSLELIDMLSPVPTNETTITATPAEESGSANPDV